MLGGRRGARAIFLFISARVRVQPLASGTKGFWLSTVAEGSRDRRPNAFSYYSGQRTSAVKGCSPDASSSFLGWHGNQRGGG